MLNVAEVRVGFVPESPLTTPCFHNNKDKVLPYCNYHGAGVEFMNILMLVLNKSIVLRYSAHTFGTIMNNLTSGQIDVTIPQMWLTNQRLQVLQLGVVLPNFGIYQTGFLVNPGVQIQIAPLFRGFSVELWLAGALMYFIVALFMQLIVGNSLNTGTKVKGIRNLIPNACFTISFYQRNMRIWSVTMQTTYMIVLYSVLARVVRTVYLGCYLKSKVPFIAHVNDFNSVPKITKQILNGYELFLDQSVFGMISVGDNFKPLRLALESKHQYRLVDRGDPDKLAMRTMEAPKRIFWNSVALLRYYEHLYSEDGFVATNRDQIQYLTGVLMNNKFKKYQHILSKYCARLIEMGLKDKIFIKYGLTESTAGARNLRNQMRIIQKGKKPYDVYDLIELNLFAAALYVLSCLLFATEMFPKLRAQQTYSFSTM